MSKHIDKLIETDFPLLEELDKLRFVRTKKLETLVIKAAQKWLPYKIHWSGGLAIAEAPFGDYIYHFAVRIEQEKRWNFPEFREGYQFGLNPQKPYRDANPYQEWSRTMSWDCGYILGLHDSSQG